MQGRRESSSLPNGEIRLPTLPVFLQALCAVCVF